jgi:hypothetical protein
MLWLVINEDLSYQIVSCNISQKGDVYELWVTRPNEKSLKIKEDTDKAKLKEIKDAIDFAIETKEPVLRLA